MLQLCISQNQEIFSACIILRRNAFLSPYSSKKLLSFKNFILMRNEQDFLMLQLLHRRTEKHFTSLKIGSHLL